MYTAGSAGQVHAVKSEMLVQASFTAHKRLDSLHDMYECRSHISLPPEGHAIINEICFGVMLVWQSTQFHSDIDMYERRSRFSLQPERRASSQYGILWYHARVAVHIWRYKILTSVMPVYFSSRPCHVSMHRLHRHQQAMTPFYASKVEKAHVVLSLLS